MATALRVSATRHTGCGGGAAGGCCNRLNMKVHQLCQRQLNFLLFGAENVDYVVDDRTGDCFKARYVAKPSLTAYLTAPGGNLQWRHGAGANPI